MEQLRELIEYSRIKERQNAPVTTLVGKERGSGMDPDEPMNVGAAVASSR